MTKENPMKGLFEFMKSLGHYPNEDWEEYRLRVYGPAPEEDVQKEQFNQWVESMPEDEQRDFNYVFQQSKSNN